MLHKNSLYSKSALLYCFLSQSKIETEETLAEKPVCLEGWGKLELEWQEGGTKGDIALPERERIWMGPNTELSQKYHLDPSPESRCLKNGNTCDCWDLHLERGSKHANSIWVKWREWKCPPGEPPLIAWSRSLHLGLQMVLTKIPDILDKCIAGSSQTRWLESGHQTASFAASDIMENRIKRQGKFWEPPSILEYSSGSEIQRWGCRGRGADVSGTPMEWASHAGELDTTDTVLAGLRETMVSAMKS